MGKSRRKTLISQREYARRLGISHTSVQRAVKAGRISTVDGKIDPSQADREWQQNTDQSKPRNRLTGKPKSSRVPEDPPEPMDLAGLEGGRSSKGGGSSYAKGRAARELWQAQLTKLRLDRERAKLVRADQVRVAAFNASRSARDKLMAMPRRVSAVIAATEDVEEIRRILEEEIERICVELSGADVQ